MFLMGALMMAAALTEKPCGTWDSPITAELITHASKRFGNIVLDGDNYYWTELRPDEEGRTLIVSEKGDITPPGYSVRTRINEYGGLAFTVQNHQIYFVNDKDQRLYVQKDTTITPLTEPGIQFGDLLATPFGIVSVIEKEGHQCLGLIDNQTGAWNPLASQHDFYSSPTLSSDGKQLAWLTWNLPNLPWDGTELWVGEVKDKKLLNVRKVAGGMKESIFQPQWSPDNTLHFVSDKTGWWNLYQEKGREIVPLHPLNGEFGLPQWVLGMSTYGFLGNQILCTYFENGKWNLALLKDKKMTPLSLPGEVFTQVRCGKGFGLYISASSLESPSIRRLTLDQLEEKIVATTKSSFNDQDYLSIAEPVSFPSQNGRTAYGYYYPPKNKHTQALKGELPPLIVKAHGGPTAQVTGAFSLAMQYWTSRGFAVLDVNYGGSTGYGRTFRDSLKNNWGIVDVQDCEAGALYLVKKGLADPKRLIITGGSAGGYTTLAALTFGKTFSAGSSYFGVSDLIALTRDTHRFESRYLDDLIGPYPEKKELYEERSPVNFPDKIHSPVIFFQGREDKIVPVNQAELMYDALKKKGITTKLIIYEGEQHGFRKSSTIQNALEEELAFYKAVFKIK